MDTQGLHLSTLWERSQVIRQQVESEHEDNISKGIVWAAPHLQAGG